jgi:5-methylcytosine-specific restriction protein A
MSVFLLTWNPKRWPISADDWTAECDALRAGEKVSGIWSIGVRTSGVNPGDIVLLVRVGSERGIVASGFATSTAYKGLHYDERRRKRKDLANFVNIEWSYQVEIEKRLRTEVLINEFPEVAWNNLVGSGVKVSDDVAESLVAKWLGHIGENPLVYPDEEPLYTEGRTTPVLVNRYERNPAAREECLRIHGTVCAVCSFDGEAQYGPKGRRLIHVHHLVELSTIGEEYVVNPSTDLIPVCPNCHAMIHRRRPAYSVSDIRRIIKAQRNK